MCTARNRKHAKLPKPQMLPPTPNLSRTPLTCHGSLKASSTACNRWRERMLDCRLFEKGVTNEPTENMVRPHGLQSLSKQGSLLGSSDPGANQSGTGVSQRSLITFLDSKEGRRSAWRERRAIIRGKVSGGVGAPKNSFA